MKTKSLVLIIVSLGFGCFAAFGMLQVMARSKSGPPVIETAPVLVAKADLEINDELTEENVEIEQWPIEMVPEGVMAGWDGTEGSHMATRVIKGYPIQADMVLQPGEFKGLNVRKGYQLYAVKVSDQMVFAGLLEPGMRVNLIGILRIRGRGEIVKTFLSNIRVFSTGDQVNRVPGREEDSKDIRVVNLEVTQTQAEKIAFVESMGALKFALNSDYDIYATSDEDAALEEEESIQEIFGLDQEPANPSPAAVADNSPPQTPQVAASEPVKPMMMTIVSASGSVAYTWTDRDSQPSELDTSGSFSSMPGAVGQSSAIRRDVPPAGARGSDSTVRDEMESSEESDSTYEEDDVEW